MSAGACPTAWCMDSTSSEAACFTSPDGLSRNHPRGTRDRCRMSSSRTLTRKSASAWWQMPVPRPKSARPASAATAATASGTASSRDESIRPVSACWAMRVMTR